MMDGGSILHLDQFFLFQITHQSMPGGGGGVLLFFVLLHILIDFMLTIKYLEDRDNYTNTIQKKTLPPKVICMYLQSFHYPFLEEFLYSFTNKKIYWQNL